MTSRRSVAPFVVAVVALLLASRAAADLFVTLMPLSVAWVPTLLVYYAAIEVAVRHLPAKTPVPVRQRGPAWNLITFGLVLPALLPAGFFVLNVTGVPWEVLAIIPIFAVINAWFEERFWRGVLAGAPMPAWAKILASGALFSFSHWFFTGAYWFSAPRVLWSVVATTFLMGLAWMWFYVREGRLRWVVASHAVVDILNLSVAMFVGVPMRTV